MSSASEEVSSLSEEAAADMLTSAGGDLRIALVMAKCRVGEGEARDMLSRHGGRVKAAVMA